MRETVERVLRWITIGLGVLIIASCTALGGATLEGIGVLAGLAGGAVIVVMLLGWFYIYLIMRSDIGAMQRTLAQLEQRQRVPAAGHPAVATATRAAPNRRGLVVALVVVTVGATLFVPIRRRLIRSKSPPDTGSAAQPGSTPNVPSNSVALAAGPALAASDPRLAAIVSEQLGVPVADVRVDSTLASLGGDSLDAVELIMAVEEDYRMEIPDDQVRLTMTAGELSEYLRQWQWHVQHS